MAFPLNSNNPRILPDNLQFAMADKIEETK